MNQNIFENTMAEMTWPEIEALAAEGALVLLPVGVIEEHGEHLPLGTDTYLAYAKEMCIRDSSQTKQVQTPPQN